MSTVAGLEVTTKPRLPRHDPQAGARIKAAAVRYVGFQATKDGREYTCRVDDSNGQRTFVLFITHQAFATREARFQDAPDLCCTRLARELLVDPDLLDGSRLALTSEEMLDYRSVRERGVPGRKRGAPAGAATP